MQTSHYHYKVLHIPSSSQGTGSLSDYLQGTDYDLSEAKDQQEAITIAANISPDITIIDLVPSQSPLTLVKELRRAYGQTAILFKCPQGCESLLGDVQSCESSDFIIEPFTKNELTFRLQNMISILASSASQCHQYKMLKIDCDAKDKQYSVIAHDLRAPIGTIKMINATLESLKNKIGNPYVVKLFEMINETTEDAFNLLENLLRWTRNQNGKTKVYPTSFNISAAIRQVVSLSYTIASSKEVNLHNNALKEYNVCADEDMIKTVLRNLVSNAIKFTYAKGYVEINVSETPQCVTVSIKDNGKGIPETVQSKLLKAGSYITTYDTHNQKGSGLGLLLCRDFIKMNKGKLWFTSQEGAGSTFYFSLPKPGTNNQQAAESR